MVTILLVQRHIPSPAQVPTVHVCNLSSVKKRALTPEQFDRLTVEEVVTLIAAEK
jgi:hypothetical protein